MSSRVEEVIEFTRTKFGLDNYYLKGYQFDRSVNIFKETVYTMCMEWFPNHATVQEDDDSNPEGTAVIEIDINSLKLKSAIFVMGKTFAEYGVEFAAPYKFSIIKWIEQETGLMYGKQFQLQKEEDGNIHFRECINGVAVSPSGSIEIKFDHEGKLTFFSIHGQFPSEELIREEEYSLSLDSLSHLKKEQLKLVEFPSFEQKKIYPVYAVEEIYIANDQSFTIPFEFFVDRRSYLTINKIIYWESPINKPFEREEIRWIDEITEEQALSCEPSPDSFPISKEEQEKCVLAVKDFLRREYPNDAGNWILKSLYREKGYIHAILKANKQDDRVFERKVKVFIDAKRLQVVNYMDNKLMLEIFDQFNVPEKATITKDEAYEKIKELFELKPYYVYDFKQSLYVLCGKLDCDYGVIASNGEIIALDDL